MKPIVRILVAVAAAGSAWAQSPSTAANPSVRHVIGLEPIKRNAAGTLTVRDGALWFKTSKAEEKVPVASIDDIFIGTEITQSGGKTGRIVKTAAMAAPFESGKALTILMRTKVDILTVSFHDSGRRPAWRHLRASPCASFPDAHATGPGGRARQSSRKPLIEGGKP